MIEASALTKRYGRTVAVDHLSFIVRPGRVTGFLGPNGAGKSTTMRMILGLDAPTSGSITVNGRHFTGLIRPLHQVGALLDATAVHGGRSAHAHLAALARSNGIGRARVAAVLNEAGLAGVAGKRVGGFSLGMKQRLGIAGALLGDPGILMFDEPVNGLDPEGIRWIRTLCRTLAGQGRTVLVSSHLMSEMALTADHLIVIGRGRLIADTSITDFTSTGPAVRVLIRCLHGEDMARLLRSHGAAVAATPDGQLSVTGCTATQIGVLAAANNLPIYELHTDHASLEEAFMALTAGSVEFQATTNDPARLAGAPAPAGAARKDQ